MASIAISHLCKMIESDDIGVAYLFCNYKAQADQSAPSLLAALAKQLVLCRPDIAAPVTQIYDYHLIRKSRPSLDEVFTALQSICSNYPTVYIIVDALDECSNSNGDRDRLIDKLHDLQARIDVRLLFTSRSISEITQKLRSNPLLEVRASEEDVRRFIASQMLRLPKHNEQLKAIIEARVVEAVDGM
jgi:hypothetical protein